MDESSAQLASELRASAIYSLQTRRPLLHHLNADTSWLLQIPRPQTAVNHSGRHWFNILIDPWLSGSQSDVASWFSQQWHAIESKVASIDAVEELAWNIEIWTAGSDAEKCGIWSEAYEDAGLESLIDVVAISHEFTDHCHQNTLLEINKNVPVIATAQAAKLIRSWKHFRTVVETPAFSAFKDWRDVSVSPLPDWVSIARLTTKSDLLYYHSALMIAFRPTADNYRGTADEYQVAEAVIYTPHGISASDLAVVAKANPPIKTLAFLHGLHDVSLGQQLNLGAHNGLAAQRVLRAKYWIGTHDEVKRGGGLVNWFLKRKIITLKDALELESRKEINIKGEMMTLEKVLEEIDFLDAANGETVVLT